MKAQQGKSQFYKQQSTESEAPFFLILCAVSFMKVFTKTVSLLGTLASFPGIVMVCTILLLIQMLTTDQ